ncbi:MULTISPECIES: response regulator [Achromobacter]|jgi:DNA-binding NarL/FixJ family response regulator|uniref:Response regulator transcription factor n=1 Tax=Achromobacter marplatensis TaxID=470868 RepID=A0AA43B4X1_9BURK|nr:MULTISPECIES: response regulator transcription factor [Achromobacter]EJO33422.1 LuxR family transcriptional regulator [Achromobacter marplatensis]MDH2054049.1 response regulator transcription factor [Achromobacter marplatensis]NMK50405.1 response regulator transcription factor [Achromobacter sp. Bel]
MALNLLIVDDHLIIRRGLARILEEDPRVALVHEAADAPSALRALRQARYDAMVLDVALGERDGLDVLKTVRADYPALGVVMLSVYPETQFAVRALRTGAHAYLNKGCDPDELLAALVNAAAGKMYVTPAVAELLAQTVRQDSSRLPHELLSNREFQVLQLLVAGRSVSAIGEQLALSVNTISTYRSRIFEKLGVRTLVELVAYANTHQLGAP